MKKQSQSIHGPALKITGIYTIVGILWILLSDRLLVHFIPHLETIHQVQTLKGWFFVLVTALLIYLLVSSQWRARTKALNKLNQSRQDLRTTINSAEMGYWAWDSGQAIDYSRIATEILHIPPEMLPTSPREWSDWIHPEDRTEISSAILDHVSGNSDTFCQEFRIWSGDNVWTWVLGTGRIVKRSPDSTPVRALGIVMDISARKEAEEGIQLAQKETEEANRSKSIFLAGMSHELRTPLNGVLAMLQLLHESRLDKETRQFVQTAYDSGQSLLRIINNLLSLTGAEAGKLRLHEDTVSLRSLVDTVIGTMIPQLPKGVTLRRTLPRNLPPEIRTDAGKIEQICYNLIGNALKHTHTGSIEVNLDRLPHTRADKRLYLLSITDHGCGIAPEILENIFKPYAQNRSRAFTGWQGAGLGMDIVRRLVTVMEGSICIDTEDNQGTTVAVLLPMQEETGDGKPQVIKERSQGLRILVVDDDRINRMAVKRFLEKLQHIPSTAPNGVEAIKSIRDAEFDCVLMDIQMPEMDGLETTRKLRRLLKIKTSPHVPVIAMTAHVLEEDRHQFEMADMDGFLPKPIQIDSLADEIERVVAAKKDLLEQYREDLGDAASPQ